MPEDEPSKLSEINKKLDSIMSDQKKIMEILRDLTGEKSLIRKDEESAEQLPLDVVTLLSLPDHIRKTAYALSRLGGEATAEEVAKETERTRAAESANLSQLQRMGYINRKRQGHKVVYSIPS